jgi:FtsP/CotA-like multicopper oxidase with cupredoxin domain
MLAYNGSVPGPTLRVPEGAEVDVVVENEGDLDTTVHWHGLRLENRSDGTLETQDAIPVGGTYTCRVAFPDPGAYWYHPHIREDYAQELGLYGGIIVVPPDDDYWAPAHRELTVTLDDVLHGAGRFLVLARDGKPEPNLVWSDTVLVRNGEVVDIVLDVTNAGRWMAHCHIAEHHESGMHFSFDVEP